MKEEEYEIETRPCDKCNGTGEGKEFSIIPGINQPCDKCLGTGELDWLEYILGKRNHIESFLNKWTESLRIINAGTIASKLVSVQPMEKSESIVYFKKVKFKEKE